MIKHFACNGHKVKLYTVRGFWVVVHNGQCTIRTNKRASAVRCYEFRKLIAVLSMTDGEHVQNVQ